VSEQDRTARYVRAHGRVQGVFFRASTRQRAREVGLGGWVRNRPDGSVDAWLEGDPEDVAVVERWIRAGGPRSARVDEVEAEDREPEGHDRFEVRH
jgi:acylphosphatase